MRRIRARTENRREVGARAPSDRGQEPLLAATLRSVALRPAAADEQIRPSCESETVQVDRVREGVLALFRTGHAVLRPALIRSADQLCFVDSRSEERSVVTVSVMTCSFRVSTYT